MKLPSLQQVLTDTGRTLRRFPLIVIDAAIGTLTALVLVDHEGPEQPTVLFSVLLAAALGIPLLLAIALSAEKRKWTPASSLAAQAAGLAALAGYGWTIPLGFADAPMIHAFRFFMIAAALHLFVAVGPFAGSGETNGFWHYNKELLLRALTAGLFSMVLVAGLAIALAAVDNLFGIHIPDKRYGELWVFVAGMFTTLFFLGGVPENLDALERSVEYPKVIKIFAQYILLPLVMVYLVILYAYLGKILIAWEWPQGWVSRLILGFAAAGMLMHLLLYPVRDREENVWIKSAMRWLYVVMLPLVGVYMLAVWRRISEYGVTEGRYVAVATGIWLGAMVLYFLVSKGKNIKVIPASLGVIPLLICFGPWGAFSVSESSQAARLQELLSRASILVDGTVRPAGHTVPYEETKQISSIIEYFHSVHGYDRIQPWFRESLRADSAGEGLARKDPTTVAKLMGLEYVQVWEGGATNGINLRADADQAIDVRGYDRLWRGQVFNSDRKRKEVPGGGFAYRVSAALDTLTLFATPAEIPTDSIQVDLRQFVERLLPTYKNANASNIPPERMAATFENERMKVKIYLLRVNGRREDGVLKLLTYECVVLYSATVSPPSRE